MSKKNKIVILGGGLAGLAAADKLLDKEEYEILIIEKTPFLGGLASSFKIEGEQIPVFNHHIVKSNKTTISYLNRYNLMGKNVWKKIQIAIAVNGKLYNINKIPNLLRFNFLSFPGRIRLGLFGAYLIFLLNPNKIPDNMNAEEWLLKHAGKEVTYKIWQNLYARNKFNIKLSDISAKQFANRLHEKEGYDDFTYPQKGIQGMIDGLEKDIKIKKGKILKNTKIKEIDIKNKTIKYKNKKEKFDILINTIPVPEFIKFAKNLPKTYISKIKKVRYVPVVSICLGTKNFLDKQNYWINLINEDIHVIYQHSLLIDKYKSKVTWCVKYGKSEEDFKKSDKEIEKEYLKTVKKYFPNIEVNWCKVFKEKYAEPIYDKDYIIYCPKYETEVPCLFNAGIQVTFPKIRNMNVALQSGIKIAQIIKDK